MLRTAISQEILPHDVLDREINTILQTGVQFLGGTEITPAMFDEMKERYDAVVVAAGTLEKDTPVFGLHATPKGIVADKNSYQTSDKKVFAIGNVLRSSKLAVRSVGQGKEVAFSVIQFLDGRDPEGEPRMFNSRFGKLVSEEFSEYLREASPEKRLFPGLGGREGFSREEAIAEAQRCLHCDCRAIDDCKLRVYADEYKADQKRFKTSERRNITRMVNHQAVIFEPQKCVRCGICVRLTEKYGEKFGFTYIGRGFDVEIGIPFNEDLEKGLSKIAEKVANGCPTGAIALRKKL